jgi:hypothetical protein
MGGADRERTAVYVAEQMAFDGTDLERVLDVGTVGALVAGITGGNWWPAGRVGLRRPRADARSSSCTWGPDAPVVAIAAGQATVATIAHELAHALAGADAGHGPTFRRALLDVVQVATNLDDSTVRSGPIDLRRRGRLHVDQLSDALGAAGLGVGDRAWPPPPDVGGSIAL